METSELMKEAKNLLASVKEKSLTVEQRGNKAVALAALLLKQARLSLTSHEKKKLTELAMMLNDPIGKVFTINMTDRCFRSQQSKKVVEQLNEILKQLGIPHYLSGSKKIALRLFMLGGRWLPWLFVPAIKALLRKETATVILPGEPLPLKKHMEKRREEHVRINLNHLGEAILSENEALRRLAVYLEDLEKPEVEYISVKISTIYSQIHLLAWQETLHVLADRFKMLLRKAADHRFQQADGTSVPKFVNLDMEEYRDLKLTLELFKHVLDEDEFKKMSAGIVLQAYLPDSFKIQQELTAWACQRIAKGGAPIKIRIVKGANLAMEQVEASLRCWPQAPYPTKLEVDANFKRMLTYGMSKNHAQAVFLGIGSHNLFDIAYAMLLSIENQVENYVCYEMLEGMADHMRRVVQALTGDMLLYCPAATKEEFQHALAYLVRRLDENTTEENFLKHAFGMQEGTKEWDSQVCLFMAALQAIEQVSSQPRRTQNQALVSPLVSRLAIAETASFENEPDTDWTLPQNRQWADKIVADWKNRTVDQIPLVIQGQKILSLETAEGKDPSIPERIIYHYSLADLSTVSDSLHSIKQAEAEWQAVSCLRRCQLLKQVAQVLRLKRAALIGAMIADTGKTILEADVEVSEAIDFAEYYARNLNEIYGFEDISWHPKGTILVAPPWNFPCSIPAGGLIAALAAGNCVLFKPAPEAVLVGWELVNALWEGGIDPKYLYFMPCCDEPVGTALLKSEQINGVILTGATETAQLFRKIRPSMDLMAETGGKNAIIVTAAADRDLAIKDIIQSAFGHAGQKCSACSLVILEAEVYDDPHFRKQLKEAAASLHVGSAWDMRTKVNPLIRPPQKNLMKALTTLEKGEEWLLKPEVHPTNPQLWGPGIKMGVTEGSFTHQTELFGPLLGLMRAKNFDEAIRLANATPFGLTAGLESLDEREKAQWLQKIEAGNCYINRGITGAIVQRQPFGGCKDSSFGPGAKAGGPNYLMQLMHPVLKNLPVESEKLDDGSEAILELAKLSLAAEDFVHLKAAFGHYRFYWQRYFNKDHDPSMLLGQDNFFGYRPPLNLCVRIQPADTQLDLWKVIAVASIIKMPFEISCDTPQNIPLEEVDLKIPQIIWSIEQGAQWLQRLQNNEIKKVRLLSEPAPALLQVLAEDGVHFQVSPILANGRIELLKFLREVSISHDYHRYGNLGAREKEKRKQLCI